MINFTTPAGRNRQGSLERQSAMPPDTSMR